MARLTAAVLALALGLGAAFALVSCGSDDKGLLPGDTAENIESNLNEVADLAKTDCTGAQSAAADVQSQVANLGGQVDPKLKQALVDGAAHLVAVTQNCAVEATSTPETSDTAEPSTEETTSESETTDTESETTQSEPTTETTQTQPTNETTAPPPPPSPPQGGGGGGNVGEGGGSGGSGGVGPGRLGSG